MSRLSDRLNHRRPILLDGALGTELDRRGIALPEHIWSSGALLSHPEIVRQIHSDYVQAGVEWITANTFRLHRRNLRRAGLEAQSQTLTQLAVRLARQALHDNAVEGFVLGSLAPLEDCYRPELVPGDADLQNEHGETAEHLAEAGVDLILVETQNNIREARFAADAAAATGVPFAVSFVCGKEAKLLSGEPLGEAVAAILDLAPKAVMVNCLPAAGIPPALAQLQQRAQNIPIGVYPNTGELATDNTWRATSIADPAPFAGEANNWLRSGAKIIGGCCGTTPEHIGRVKEFVTGTEA